MSCSVAVGNSAVFSPQLLPLTFFPSPENLAGGLTRHQISPAATTSLSRAAPLLKRKRPPHIDIPMIGLEAIEPALGSDGRREIEEDCVRFSVYCKRGRKRIEMEDRYCADFDRDCQMAFFGVFDGHGGSKAAEFVSEKIGKHVMEEMMNSAGEESKISAMEEIKNGYLKTDAEFLNEKVRGGTCCVTALVSKGDLIVSNAGDCRAVLSVSGAAEALTSDHRPSRDDEKDRIERSGGYIDCCRGVWRLQGSLAVTRGIGDSHLKKWVVAEPETRVIKIESECEFLILASDGLWDKVSNQEAVDIARPMCLDVVKPNLLSACKKLVNLSISRGSMDDISVMIIPLGQFV